MFDVNDDNLEVDLSRLPLKHVGTGFLDVHQQREEVISALGLIHRFTEQLAGKPGADEFCEHVVRVIIEDTDFENCSIALWNAQRQCLAPLAAYSLEDWIGDGGSVAARQSAVYLPVEDVALQVFGTRAPVFYENLSQYPMSAASSDLVRPEVVICLPLLHLGVLTLTASTPRAISGQQRRSWTLLAEIMGHLIQSAILQEQQREKNQRLQLDVDDKTRTLEHKSQALLAANSFLEVVIDNAPQGICMLDASAYILRLNDSMERLQGDRREQLTGRNPSIIFRKPALFKNMMDRLATSGAERLVDVSMLRSNGEFYPADVFLARLTDKSGAVMGYLMVVDDLTEKKAVAEQLLRAEKLTALGTMAGGVAHDFNNLLTTILGNTQLLLLQTTDTVARQRLENIEMAVRDGAHTVRRLQEFTRIDRGPRPCQVAVDVAQVVADVIELTRPRWKNASEKHGSTIQLHKDLQPGCMVPMHASDLREVLTNLIFNAVDAMPNGGSLILNCRAQGNAVFLEVADTGVGMTEETQRKIFDPFFTTKGVTNSGLGLSISYGLIKRNAGDIQVKSTPGKGSLFQLQLPRSELRSSEVGPQEVVDQITTRKLLVIDDEKDVLHLVQEMLRMAGHEVTAFNDGREALEWIEGGEFDLVFTDLGMPGVNGWDIAKKVKECKPDVPVVMISGWGAQYEDQDLKSRGIDLVLSKPLSYQQLLGAIEKML
jgi:PAS domain S-box-containing protein